MKRKTIKACAWDDRNGPRPLPPLPPGILASDVKMPSGSAAWRALVDDHDERSFDLLHTTSMGWVIPTLLIRRAGSRARMAYGATDRTYAVRVEDGGLVRAGHGPHITATATVWVRKARAAKLARFVALRRDGEVKSNEVRDRISTRRARTEMRRLGL